MAAVEMGRAVTIALKKPRGVVLIEALVALLIMAFGMVALAGLQSTLRRSADLARQRGDAMRLAEETLEKLRSFSVVTNPNDGSLPAGTLAYSDIVDTSQNPVSVAVGNTTYSVVQYVTAQASPAIKTVQVVISWHDLMDRDSTDTVADATQYVTLDTQINGIDPSFSGGLSLTPPSTGLALLSDRSATIPSTANNLGNGTSVLKPVDNGTVAWVFNNVSGVITGKCTVPFGTPTSALTAADVESCNNNTIGYLLSGTISFSWTAPPVSDVPAGPSIPVGIAIALTQSSTLTPSYECFNDGPSSGTGNTFVNYNCIIYPTSTTPPVWSGTVNLSGLTFTGANAVIVCRYSADYNGNGVIDNNEHPAAYANVSNSLTNQNFLVISGTQSCPAGHAVDPTVGDFTNTATVQQQP